MNYKKITIEDKAVFDEYYENNPQYSSYVSFVTLFTWRECSKFRYITTDNEIIIKCTSFINHKDFIFLPQQNKDALKIAVSYLEREEPEAILLNLTKNQKQMLGELFPQKFSFKHVRDNDNYYYLTESLLSLKGKKLHGKRNHINKFSKLYDYSYISLDRGLAQDCLALAELWSDAKAPDNSIDSELHACREALTHFEELGLTGGALTVGGNIIAFSLGEALNPETALIHFEKADVNYQGSFTAMNNEFIKNEWTHTKYINREEDMGVEGLRKSKMSYRPEFMLKTYIARRI